MSLVYHALLYYGAVLINVCFALQELRQAYEAESSATGHPRLLVTAAVASKKLTIDAGYEIPQIAK